MAAEDAAKPRRLTIADVPSEVEFVDEDGNVLADYGVLKIDPFFAQVVIDKARRWRQSIDTTLHRMVHAAIKQYIAKRKAAAT